MIKIIGTRQTIVHLNNIITNLPKMDKRTRKQYADSFLKKIDSVITRQTKWVSGVTSHGGKKLRGGFTIVTHDDKMTGIGHMTRERSELAMIERGVPHTWRQDIDAPNIRDRPNPIWDWIWRTQKRPHPPNQPLSFVKITANEVMQQMKPILKSNMNINNLKRGG